MPKKKKASAEDSAPLLHTMAQSTEAQKTSQQLSELPDLKQHPDAPKIAGYMLIKPLGRGAYAQVWEAIQLRTRKFVAVKVFIKKSGVHWFFLQREADRLIRLDKHPNIVSLLDADLSGEVPYYVMDLAQEGSLERFIEGAAPGSDELEVDRIAGWMDEVAQALHYVHAKQMVHCDLKPANLLVDEEGHVRVADFGNSRVLSESGGTLGTLFYMAPEQAVLPAQDSILQPDVRWDVYALGCTIYSMCSNRVPHADISPQLEKVTGVEERLRIYRQAVETQPVPDLFTVTKGEVDRDLSAIVAKCMAVNPDGRYATTTEILKDLKARREGRPVSPLAHDMGYWLGKFFLRYRTSILIAALSLAAVLTTLYFLSKHQTAQIQDTAFNYVLRGKEFLDKGDEASAVAYFTAANKLFPSLLAQGNAAFYMPPMPKAFFAHDGPLVDVTYSPDGKILLTAGGTTGARLWNAETGQAMSRSFKLDGALTAAAFNRDGSKLVLGGAEGRAQVFDVATQEPRGRAMDHGKQITSVAFSDDGRRVLTAGVDGKAREWDADTGTSLKPVMEHDKPLYQAVFNTQGDRVLTIDKEGAVQLWDADSGNAEGDSVQVDLKGAPPWYRPSTAFNPNGKGFLVTGWDGAVKFYDNHGKRSGHVLFLEGIGARAVYSPDGSRILASYIFGGSMGVAKVFKSKGHAPLKFSLKTDGKIAVLAFSADGKEVLTGGTDHVVRVWDAETGKPTGRNFWLGDTVTAAAFDPGGKTLAAGSKDGLACLWPLAKAGMDDAAPLEWSKSGREHYRKLQTHALFSPDAGKVLTYGGKTACLWNGETGEALGKVLTAGGIILRPVFSPDGVSLLTCDLDDEARLWNLDNGKFLALPHQGPVHGAAFSVDGKTLLTGGDDKTLWFWDAKKGDPIGKPFNTGFPIAKVFLGPNGKRMAALGSKGAFGLYALDKEGTKPLVEMKKGVKNAALSPNGRILLLASGRACLVLDAETGKRLQTLDHGMGLDSVLVSPDNGTAGTLGTDGTIRLWNLHTGLPIGNALEHPGSVQDWAFSPRGEVLLVAYQDGGYGFWDSHTGEAIGDEVLQGTLAKALGFDAKGRALRILGKDGTLSRTDTGWMAPTTDVDRLLLTSEVAGRTRVTAQGSLEAVSPDQWVRFWAQYRKESK